MSKERELLKRSVRIIESLGPDDEAYNNTIELKSLVKDFFENYLDTWEESDSGREFHPITISCCRCMKIEPLNILLERMRELSEAKPAHKIRERDD